MRNVTITTIAVASWLGAAPAAADVEDDDAEEDLADMSLEELLAVDIVTASNMREQLSRAPGVVISLSRADMEARGYRELLDIFDDLPGMDVVRPWGDNYLKVYWRGYRTDLTQPFLLMIDGMVINSLWSGDASVAAAIPMSEIDHVEIVYGPASAVWGANAFMGVVNVITIAGDGPDGEDEDRLSLRVTTGTFHADRLDQRILDGVAVHRARGMRLSLAGRVALDFTDAAAGERFEYTSSHYADDPALWGGYLGFENLARGTTSPINTYGLDARLSVGGLEVGAWILSLETGYNGVYPTDRVQPYAHWVQEERTAFVTYTGNITDDVTSHTQLRFRDSGIPNRSYFLSTWDPATRLLEVSYWQARNRSASLTEDVEAKVTDAINVLAGVKYERKDLQGAYDVTAGPLLFPEEVDGDVRLPRPPGSSSPDVERPLTDDYGVYAEARLRRAAVLADHDAHGLHLGIRYDWSSVFGGAHSPTFRAGYVGELDTPQGLFVGKLLFGEGFQEPNPRQLYGGWLGSGSSPTLRPESSRTTEVNLSHTNAVVSNLVSAYYAANYNTIVNFEGGAANEGRRDVVGVDYHLRALLRPPGFDSLSLWGYYSYIWTDELTFDAANEEVHAPIGDLADHKVWLGGTATLRERYTATLRSRGVATRETVLTNPIREVRGFMVFDANVQAANVGGWPLTFALQCDNLLGTHYSHPGIRTADAGDQPGGWQGDTWDGSQGWYNSRLPQPGRRVMLTVGLDL